MTVFAPAEHFSAAEVDVLNRYFTNVDLPVFALKNLPETVKGALFARYSRSPLSLRRLFLDEFADDVSDRGPSEPPESDAGGKRATALYDRVFYEYGDDSVAQLGGAHLACEQASNLLTKVLEWGRLMSYLEQSTRYIAYDQRLGGRYRYHRDQDVLASSLGARYVGDMDRIFASYSETAAAMMEFFQSNTPRAEEVSDAAYRRAVKARALDASRGMLPAASLSNVGIYGSGQAYEALLTRMRAHPLPEARTYAGLMLTELRKVIPAFLKRVDNPARGELAKQYLVDRQAEMAQKADMLFGAANGSTDESAVTLTDFDPDGEIKMIAAMLYPHTSLPEGAVQDRVRAMSDEERMEVVRAYCGTRLNRRHRPGRALERTDYRFDVLSDYGAFRDLQRHRMLTLEWQPLTTAHGYDIPPEVEAAGLAGAYDDAMSISADLHDVLLDAEMPAQAAYAVALAYKIRYTMQMNAREAMHVLELRTTPQGHPSYRQVCQQMHQLIAEHAGHRAVAQMMQFVDHSGGPELGRLQAEQRTEERRPVPQGG